MSNWKTINTDPDIDGDLPAIPPSDYRASQAAWMVELQTRGLWNGQGWHGDVFIPRKEWHDMLEICEGTKKKRKGKA